jgi:hypothetical protein
MAFSARLDIDSLKNLRVADFSYSLSRDYDPTGRVSGILRGGVIHITVETSGKPDIFSWIVDPTKRVKGKIKIASETQPNSSLKDIEFEDASLVEYSESFHWQGGDNMMESFSISAKKVTIGGAVHENEWPK